MLWALVRSDCEETFDLYRTHAEAEADLRDALGDLPEWTGLLSVQPVRLRRAGQASLS